MLAAAARRVPGADSCSLAELPPVVGAIVANEVHDACPAHRLHWPAELYVGVGADRRFRDIEGERSDPRLERMLREAGVTPATGARYDVAPAQADLQRTLALRLERGAILAFDYGEEGAARYTRPVERLRTYLAGVRGGDPLAAPGTQDITCDVDLGAVRRAGEDAGLTTLRCEGQDAWLRAHGALAAAAALPAGSEQRLWLETFAGPYGSGAAFRVLVQARGLEAPDAARSVDRIAP
jgi:SAM-dependent MidA family methyltransferase